MPGPREFVRAWNRPRAEKRAEAERRVARTHPHLGEAARKAIVEEELRAAPPELPPLVGVREDVLRRCRELGVPEDDYR